MNSINMWGKIQKGEGTKREEISKGSKKLSVSTFAVKRTPRKNSGSLLNGENKFLPDESQKSEMFSPFLFQLSLERSTMTRRLIKPRGNNSGYNRGRSDQRILR